MKKNIFYMAALAFVGAIMTGCSSDDNYIDDPQQPANTDNVVTLTTTIGFDSSATTRALTAAGVKTFTTDDQIAVIYKNTSSETVKAVGTLTSGANTSSATFTVTLTNPKKDAAIRYIYPAAMAKATVATNATIDDDGTVDFTNLDSQDGTLATLGSSYDLCTFDADSWGGDNLPNGTMTNKLAILAITLKNSKGSSDITNNTTGLTLSDGTNSYAVSRSIGAGPIYVAIQPTSSAAIEVTATDDTNNYTKSLTGKTYAASNGYNVTWKMLQIVNLSTIVGSSYEITEDVILTGTPSNNLAITYYGDYNVTLDNVNPYGSKSITLLSEVSGGYLNVLLKGTSRLARLGDTWKAGQVTIDKAVAGGTLILTDNNSPLVGGLITINGGTVKARNTEHYCAVECGYLTVNGGALYLAGDDGFNAIMGTISAGTGITLYGWNSAWVNYESQQYVTTDNTIGAPTAWDFWNPTYPLLSAATSSDYGKVVCASGHLHDAKTAVPTGCTAVGIIGKVTSTGHGLILALQDAKSQTWTTINGWTSDDTYAGTTLKVLPDNTARGANLSSYTTLGSTSVSNWAVAQKSDYEAIFTNLGSTTSNSLGTTYDANVNDYITTGVGGSALSGYYWSATVSGSTACLLGSDGWFTAVKGETRGVRPVLGF